MDEKFEIMELLQKKGSIRTKLKLLIYGAVEVREKDIRN